ncbi:putative ubiquitin fusion degradation protein UFD1 [Plasmodium gaboni]|uniref:Putative ubiquitin fusion degradation protein UFD1 n=1 Tax=Plasmodium gaboni TaxID=647221 RepID=A0A151LTD2_9APIC|nr:putative ubiquitin fusion degradation protein UFD1 [Plasmodium gaboni]KYO02444.1 putative ubiquitin fusion degradation protein UFD1 [Plasmodium gaboni]
MDDDFVRALNKFNSKFCFSNKKNSLNEVLQNKKNDKGEDINCNKLKKDLELQYIHSSNNKICQKFLTLPLNKKSDKLKDHSDKVILPVSILKTLEKGNYKNEVEFPYTFSIKNVQNNYITHACVLEFSSNEGIIFVSDNIKQNLGLDKPQSSSIARVLITYCILSKCDFIKLDSLNDNINDIKYMKNLLENELSLNYSTLTLGDYIHINHLKFYISELEPDNAVSLINTDINVDICERTNIDEYKNVKTMGDHKDIYEIIKIDIPINNTIQKAMNKYKFIINNNILDLLKKGKIELAINLESNMKLNCLNLFISFPPLDSVSEVIHHLYIDDCNTDPIVINREIIKSILKIHFACLMKEEHCNRNNDNDDANQNVDNKYNSTSNDNLENDKIGIKNYDESFLEYIFEHFFPHIIYIGVHNYMDTLIEYNICLKLNEEKNINTKKDDNNNKSVNGPVFINNNNNNINLLRNINMITPDTENIKSDDEYITCDNCLKDILKYNIYMHKIHCMKNFILCNTCKKVLKKNEKENHIHCDICNEGMYLNEKEKHEFIWHTQIKCVCNKILYRKQFIFHQNLFCPKKIIYCTYCNIFTQSNINIYNEEFILATFFDIYDNVKTNNSTINKSIKYYYNILFTYFHFFFKYIKNTEHEKYCGSKSINCTICKKIIYRNDYLFHLNTIHHFNKTESFKIINDNVDFSQLMNDTKHKS